MLLRLIVSVLLIAPLAVSADEGADIDFTLKSYAGPNLRLAEQRGAPVLLVFVAPWCGSCGGYARSLDSRLADMQSDTRLWLMDLGDRSHNHNDRFRSEHGARLLDQKGRVARRLDIDELPAWLLIDRDGNAFASGSDDGGSDAPLLALQEISL